MGLLKDIAMALATLIGGLSVGGVLGIATIIVLSGVR